MTTDLHLAVEGVLASVEQRYTPRRRALVRALAAAGKPLTLPDVLAAEPTLVQSSAYRNLAVLEAAGVVHRVIGPASDFARYELAEGLTEHHHHLVCTGCGAVADVSIPHKLERAIERAIGELAETEGFEVDAHRLDLLGRCRPCASGSATTREAELRQA